MEHETKSEIVIQLERNYFLSIVFFVLSVITIAIITLFLRPYIPNSFSMFLLMMFQCIILIVLLGRRFFQRKVEYKVVSTKKTSYGESIRLERID